MHGPPSRSPRPPRIPNRLALAAFVAWFAAAPAHAALPKAAVLGVSGGEGLSAGAPALVEELLLNALHRTGRISVIGRSDVSSMIGFERQKQLVGCDDATCMAEISGALGVRYLVVAHAGRLGAASVVTVKLLDCTQARVVARAARQVRDEAELPVTLEALAAELVQGLPSPGGAGAPTWSLVALGAGGACAVVGTVLGLSARGTFARDAAGARDGVHGVTQAELEVANGRAVLADVALAAAAVGLVAGGIGFFLAPAAGGGADVAITGRF